MFKNIFGIMKKILVFLLPIYVIYCYLNITKGHQGQFDFYEWLQAGSSLLGNSGQVFYRAFTQWINDCMVNVMALFRDDVEMSVIEWLSNFGKCIIAPFKLLWSILTSIFDFINSLFEWLTFGVY